MFKKAMLLMFVGLLFVIGVNAQDFEVARIRIVHIISDMPALQTYLNGEVFGDFANPSDLTNYEEVTEGNYDVTFAAQGEGTGASAILSLSIAVEAGHDYTIVLEGSVEGATVAQHVIDETVAFGGLDPQAAVPLIFIHDLQGAPAASLWVNGQALVENIAYGDVTTAALPIGAISGVQVTAADDTTNVLLAPPFLVDTEFAPDVSWLFVASGTYPGQPGQDMFLYAIPTFEGELAVTDQDTVEVGIPVEGELNIGERERYALTLGDDTILTITLSASEGSALDSYIRIYDADGELLAENDEINFGDDVLDAGVLDYVLPAGSYWIEVGSYRDASSGTYLLTTVLA